nr:hypothetical protein B0A51_09643 [Rachicladosporium sp. CCFEE 5018]
MEDYPPSYTEHNLPLVLLLGLSPDSLDDGSSTAQRQESGTRLHIQSPQCESERARHLAQHFLALDGTLAAWNATALPGPAATMKYRMRSVGRTWTLAPRKAAPPPQSPDEGNRQSSPSKHMELHSTLSPLSPGSPLYPDGIMTPMWLAKHQNRVPCLVIAFFEMSMSGGSSVDDTIISDINAVRAALLRSGCKTKFAAILLSEKSIVRAPELEDRLTSIRRTASLDSKVGLFFQPPMSSAAEVSTFVHGIFNTLQPVSVEYYRDLTKHARRKKARSFVPVSTVATSKGGPQALSSIAWNARYEVKLGVFAEFRSEMDVAERHYSQAIEDLFNVEGPFETTPSWSPRFDEVRLLSDVIAMRVVRCQLWNSITSGAVQSWSNYRVRMQDLVDRRGKGTQTYSWAAWESRWAKTMSELVQRADLPALKQSIKQSVEDSSEIMVPLTYAPPERTYASVDRTPPFLMLHHPGYWLRLATSATRLRWQRALKIPEEDRLPPGQSPASALVERSNAYDCYLVPEPDEEYDLSGKAHVDHMSSLSELSKASAQELAARGQARLAAELMLALARDLSRVERYAEVLEVLSPLYNESYWRQDHWLLFGEVIPLLNQAAQAVGDSEIVLATTWESLSDPTGLAPGSQAKFTHCIDEVAVRGGITVADYTDHQRHCPITPSFAFAESETFVGDSMGCQITLSLPSSARAATVTLSNISLRIGSYRPIDLVHTVDDAASGITAINLHERDGNLLGNCNLELRPGQASTMNFTLVFREAREYRLKEIALSVKTDRFQLKHTLNNIEHLQAKDWLHDDEGNGIRRGLHHHETTAVTVLPKPPKLRIALVDLRSQYYVGERCTLTMRVTNDEAESVTGSIRQIHDESGDTALSIRWEADDREYTGADLYPLQELHPDDSALLTLSIQAPLDAGTHAIALDADYTLAGEPFTALKRTLTLEIVFATLFEAKFTLSPALHEDPWPSYFTSFSASESPEGVPHLWRVGSKLRSLADSSILIESVKAIVDHVGEDASCQIMDLDRLDQVTLSSQGVFERAFQLLTRKGSLDDRSPTAVELSLELTWRRQDNDNVSTALVPIPRMTLPTSEPRVLCVHAESRDTGADVVLQYHLENPSSHFLTFAVTFEANDDFAFSGPKHRALSLAPLSRHRIDYNLLVHGALDAVKGPGGPGRWIYPGLQVVDSYYQKTLRVQAAGNGVKLDAQKGLAVWVPASTEKR